MLLTLCSSLLLKEPFGSVAPPLRVRTMVLTRRRPARIGDRDLRGEEEESREEDRPREPPEEMAESREGRAAMVRGRGG